VLQYDFGKTVKDGKFIQTGSLNKPPTVLMAAVSKLRALHVRKGNVIQKHVNNMLESRYGWIYLHTAIAKGDSVSRQSSIDL
jgi:hypothetical protein